MVKQKRMAKLLKKLKLHQDMWEMYVDKINYC